MEGRPTSASPTVGTFQELEALASRQLLTCRSLARAVKSSVAVLSEAGSGLQRGTAAVDGDATGGSVNGQSLEARLQEEDALTAGAGRALLNACGSLGVALVGLAATLSGDVITPLEDMRNLIEADRIRSKSELARLQQQAQLHSNALSESKIRKEKALEELQTALAKREAAAGEPAKGATGSWLRTLGMSPTASRPDDGASAAESKIMQAATFQTAIVEEMALRTDAETEARMRAEAGSRDFQLRLHCVDYARKSLLQSLLCRCAAGWDDAARALQAVAEQLRSKAREMSQRKPRLPKTNGSLPDWLKNAAAAAAQEESLIGDVKQIVEAPATRAKAREEEADTDAEQASGRADQAPPPPPPPPPPPQVTQVDPGDHIAYESEPAPSVDIATDKDLDKEDDGAAGSTTATTPAPLEAPSPTAPETPARRNAAEDHTPEASKEELAKEWERVQARDLELFERESALQVLQDNLQAQQAELLERRRTLAREKACNLALLEQQMVSAESPPSFAISGDSPPRRNTEAMRVELDADAENDDCDNDAAEEQMSDDHEEDVEVDAVWDMDWTTLPGRNPSDSFPSRTVSGLEEDAVQVSRAEGATQDVDADTAADATAAPDGSAKQAENPLPADESDAGAADPSSQAEAVRPVRPGATMDASELERKLEERRRRADAKEDSKDTTPSRAMRTVEKGSMPGVHPKMAEKLEQRRRRLEQLTAEEQTEYTSEPGTA